jgi:chemotaxis protein methyltransferase CheR
MREAACAEFLQQVLPRLGLRWPGYRKVRGTVCKRLRRRLRALGMPDLAAYAALLERNPEEWARLEALCRIPISRFYRDRDVFDALAGEILPERARAACARGNRAVRCWSVGCASGEEPYTVALVWRFRIEPSFPGRRLEVLGTDVDDVMLGRAERACYGHGSLRELPPDWVARAFARRGDLYCLGRDYRQGAVLRRQDIRRSLPTGPFDVILCRNLVFTYFDQSVQREVLRRLLPLLSPGGYLVIGKTETLPADGGELTAIAGGLPIYLRAANGAA